MSEDSYSLLLVDPGDNTEATLRAALAEASVATAVSGPATFDALEQSSTNLVVIDAQDRPIPLGSLRAIRSRWPDLPFC